MRNTLDTIHATLECLGYSGEESGVNRTTHVLYSIYRKPGESVAVGWSNGCKVYEVSATSDAAILVLCDELTGKGLMCQPTDKRMDVYGQEHIDAEVKKML